jgi:hypothetical protein
MATVNTFDTRIAAIHQMRVNIKSLAAEARIIRQEESRCGLAYREMLTLHRKMSLRHEARYAQLALAFLRKRAYKTVEKSCYVPVNPLELFQKIKRKLSSVTQEEVKNWLA